jgi:hypothetical protein
MEEQILIVAENQQGEVRCFRFKAGHINPGTLRGFRLKSVNIIGELSSSAHCDNLSQFLLGIGPNLMVGAISFKQLSRPDPTADIQEPDESDS